MEAEELKLSKTVERHLTEIVRRGRFSNELARPYLKSVLTINEIISSGNPRPDPGGLPGALRWDVPGTFRGSEGTWELVVDPNTKTIVHFNFTTET